MDAKRTQEPQLTAAHTILSQTRRHASMYTQIRPLGTSEGLSPKIPRRHGDAVSMEAVVLAAWIFCLCCVSAMREVYEEWNNFDGTGVGKVEFVSFSYRVCTILCGTGGETEVLGVRGGGLFRRWCSANLDRDGEELSTFGTLEMELCMLGGAV